MTRFRFLLSVSWLAAGFAPEPLRAEAVASLDCQMSSVDRQWTASALAAWRAVAADALGIEPRPLPWILLFDERCLWHLGAVPATVAPAGAKLDLTVGVDSVPARGEAHGGHPRLPDGGELPVAITSFSATYRDPDERPFLVMALPGIWRREERHATDPALERLMRAVFAHEMTHTLQLGGLGAGVTALAARQGLGDELDDDVVQDRFGARPGFRAAYEAERDLLYAAAAENDAARRRALVARAVDSIAARRARYFIGDEAFYARLEELFLGLEGAANWVGYRVARSEGVDTAAAIEFMRRGGRHWSQDEGLALFLVIDREVSGWQRRVLAPQPAPVLTLLAEAAR